MASGSGRQLGRNKRTGEDRRNSSSILIDGDDLMDINLSTETIDSNIQIVKTVRT